MCESFEEGVGLDGTQPAEQGQVMARKLLVCYCFATSLYVSTNDCIKKCGHKWLPPIPPLSHLLGSHISSV